MYTWAPTWACLHETWTRALKDVETFTCRYVSQARLPWDSYNHQRWGQLIVQKPKPYGGLNIISVEDNFYSLSGGLSPWGEGYNILSGALYLGIPRGVQ